MSVNAIVTVPSSAEEAERSGRVSLTASTISSTDLVRKNPYCSLVAGIELCHWTIFQSPCSRWRTQVKRNSTVSSTGDAISGPPSRPSDASLAHRVDLVDQLPGVATAQLPHLLDPHAGRGLAVVPYLVGVGAEPLETGLARDPVADGLLVAVAQGVEEAGHDLAELLGGFHGRSLARGRLGRNRRPGLRSD